MSPGAVDVRGRAAVVRAGRGGLAHAPLERGGVVARAVGARGGRVPTAGLAVHCGGLVGSVMTKIGTVEMGTPVNQNG